MDWRNLIYTWLYLSLGASGAFWTNKLVQKYIKQISHFFNNKIEISNEDFNNINKENKLLEDEIRNLKSDQELLKEHTEELNKLLHQRIREGVA